jgi:hypothetical protein
MPRLAMAVWLMPWLILGCAHARSTAAAQPCRPDKILNTSAPLISLRSGQAFQAYPGSQGVMSNWAPLDKVSVCQIGGIAVSITNLTDKNASIRAVRVFPTNVGGLI